MQEEVVLGEEWKSLRNNPTEAGMIAALEQLATVKLTGIQAPWLSKQGPLFPSVSPDLISRQELFDEIGLFRLTNPRQIAKGPIYRQLTLNLWSLDARLEESKTTLSYELVSSKTLNFDARGEDELAAPND